MDRDSGDRYDATRAGSGISSEGNSDRATAKKMSLQKNHPSQPRSRREATGSCCGCCGA
jgi:hypothetical protein